MIVTSVHDPALFNEKLLADKSHKSTLKLILEEMMTNHIIVLDSDLKMNRKLFAALNKHPSIQQQYNALVDPRRIIKIAANTEHAKQLAKWIDESSSIAEACSEDEIVDVFLADKDTCDAMEEEHLETRKACEIYDYIDSDWHKIASCKSKAVGGWTKDQFMRNIIRPVVRSAKKVSIIDKIIIRAAFGDENDPSGKPSSNWGNFKKTIQTIHKEWSGGYHNGNGIFEVITWPATHVRNKDGQPLLGNALAEELGKRLGITFDQLRVMFKDKQKFQSDMHDRYLVTNQGIVLGFSKGFDLFSGDKLDPCDVYLRPSDNLITQLVSPTGNQGILKRKRNEYI